MMEALPPRPDRRASGSQSRSGLSLLRCGKSIRRPAAEIKIKNPTLEGGILFLILYLFTLVIFQNLTGHQADVLADAVQAAEGINGGVALTCNGLQCLTLFHLVEMGLRSE